MLIGGMGKQQEFYWQRSSWYFGSCLLQSLKIVEQIHGEFLREIQFQFPEYRSYKEQAKSDDEILKFAYRELDQ